MKTNSDIYAQITDTILARLAAGVIPWRKPWQGGGIPKNFVSGKSYRGVNIWLLASAGYLSPFWGTFKQIKAAGGNVKKGEKGTMIVFWNIVKKLQPDKTEKKMFFLRYYIVFNACQCEGMEKFIPTPGEGKQFADIAAAEGIVANYPGAPLISHGGDRACYIPALDAIQMPKKENFTTEAGYYSTLFHECAHSTGHKSRLNREGVTEGAGFGSLVYSREELCAEFAATFLSGLVGIGEQILDNSAAYIANWSAKLKAEPDLFLKAASEGQRAAECILGEGATQPDASEESEELATADA